MNRRAFIKNTCIGAATFAFAGLDGKQIMMDQEEYLLRAKKLHNEMIVLDSHCDTPLNLLDGTYDLSVRHHVDEDHSRIDFPRMKDGGVDASFFAVFLGQGERDKVSLAQAKEKALHIFDAIDAAVGKYPALARIATSYKDATSYKNNGRLAIYLGIENAYAIGKDISNIAEFYDLGTRYMTLCHTKNNDICDSSTDKKGAEHNGLSAFGVEVVKELNKQGIMVDVSHCSDKSFYDILEHSTQPVIASHSSARALCDHPRNLDDNMLRALAKNGGVAQLCVLNSYVVAQAENPAREQAIANLNKRYDNFEGLSDERYAQGVKEWHRIRHDYPEKRATVKDAVDHIDHMVKVAGIDHVGIGTDFDGGGGIDGFNDISEAHNVTAELLKRGYFKQDIAKIWGANFMRVFKHVEDGASV